MSSKRKDSHPTKAAAAQEEDEGEEEQEEEGSWTNYTKNGNGSQSPNRSDLARDDLIADDTSSTGNKDDDDDDDDDDGADDKFDNVGDPERLKAFNMFVRLFVDENLDRHVPISKQPKEKIQAIIDSCTRQFPEYSERARKRIRTYLKSCRRTKRSREQAGLDTNNRPSLPHLTSVHAEQLLARACENEAENAKRMRLGIEPISQPLPAPLAYSAPLDTLAPSNGTLTLAQALDKPKMEYKPEQLATLLAAGHQTTVTAVNSMAAVGSMSAVGNMTAVGSMPPVGSLAAVNGNPAILYRQAMQQTPSTMFTGSLPTGGLLQAGSLLPSNGPALTTVVTNGQPIDKKPPLLNHKLNGTEMTAVRQLITGYRESAAFLLRSADELEHLLQIQPKL